MGPSLIQRQCPVTPVGFPVVVLVLPSFTTPYFYSRVDRGQVLEAHSGEVRKLLFQPVPEGSHKDQW